MANIKQLSSQTVIHVLADLHKAFTGHSVPRTFYRLQNRYSFAKTESSSFFVDVSTCYKISAHSCQQNQLDVLKLIALVWLC